MENIIYILLAIVAGFFGVKFFKNNSNKEDNEKESQYLITDGRLKHNQKDQEKKLLALQKKMEAARKEGKSLDEKDIEDFWND